MKSFHFNINCKKEKLSYIDLYLLGSLMACGLLVSACKPSERGVGTQPPVNVPQDASIPQSPSESVKPKINLCATEKLYKKIKQKKLGSGSGPRFIRFEENTGILIHPGDTPAEVVFDVSEMKETLKIAFFIGGLPQNILLISKAGTAGFEVFVDEKSLGRKRVDRFTNETLLVDPKGASKLRIVVDNDNGVQTCDWFFMGLQ